MRGDLRRAADELPPAPPLAEVAAEVTPADEVPADRLSTVTIPHTLSPKARRRQRIARVFRWASILALVAVLGWAAWTFLIPHRTTVPDMVGDTLRTAQREADARGLEVAVSSEEFHSDVPPNRIISQSLAPGSETEEGTAIRVMISLGPQLEPVPEVTDLTEDAAVRALREAGFDPRILREYHETVPEGRVLEQNPDPGNELEVGKQVRITVSRGKAPVQVPGVTGLAQAEASSILTGAGLGVQVREDFSGEVAVGDVISQTPAGGQTVPAETTVTIVVSKGPRRFEMPDVVEMPTAETRSQLEGLGLVVRVVTVPNSSGAQVVSQDPDPGATVQQGQQVTLYVA
jgi:eukaryotic-like serine/threonine-protein kinase